MMSPMIKPNITNPIVTANQIKNKTAPSRERRMP